ncbi:MAG TPA: TonB-dependent receptor [Bryobacteraceae bacterium]|nr:TonB-dependent receptor [Bryobacteraceae bacterium]
MTAALFAQPQTATLTGTVRLVKPDEPLHHATVTIVQLRRAVETDDNGRYVFEGVPPGDYEVIAHMHGMADQRQSVKVGAGSVANLDFRLRLTVVHGEVTVTASGTEQAPLETFQSVTSVGALELATRPATSLGDALENEPGLSKRSFGPGTTRPVIRGFDGDRVLVLQDGMGTGTVSSQSGDHGEPIDPGAVDEIEVVKGPATLLYGSNAIGGVVNVITSHHQLHAHPHEGLRGYLTGNTGSNNSSVGTSAGFEFGFRKWLFSADGGAQHSGDYSSPEARVVNSATRMENVFGGAGRYGERNTFNVNYGVQDGRYGVPFGAELAGEKDAGEIDLAFRRQNVRFNYGRKGIGGAIDHLDASANYSDWTHKELEGAEIGTQFFNRQFSARSAFEQKRTGRLSGRFGFSGNLRDYDAIGIERLSPPVTQRGAAAFALEEITLERLRLQFGGRFEHIGYTADGAPNRTYDGLSGSAAVNVPLWRGGAASANYTRSYRAPALEELYNFGPHTGNLTFEIGNPLLTREIGSGVDVALRHQGQKARGELNLFYYRMGDFVYLAPTGNINKGLIEARYEQANARYMGAELHADVRLTPDVWFHTGLDIVDAQLRVTRTPLPRIPPARARFALDYRRGGFGLRPEWVLTNRQSQVFPTETPTAGYGLFNIAASYNYATQHALHVFNVALVNAADQLYRNHLSFIKNLAAEPGRGVRVTYTVRFF